MYAKSKDIWKYKVHDVNALPTIYKRRGVHQLNHYKTHVREIAGWYCLNHFKEDEDWLIGLAFIER